MQFVDREQRHHSDIFPGMCFYFVPNPNADDRRQLYTDPDPEFWSRDAPWTVIAKDYYTGISGGYWRYLLLGEGPTLQWHDGGLGWIRRIADPVWEERAARDWGRTMRDTMQSAHR